MKMKKENLKKTNRKSVFRRMIEKIVVILQIFMVLLPTTYAFADSVDFGDELWISRGDLGFYTLQYWSEYRGRWMYITYSQTFYTDKNGEKNLAYCVNPDLDGVGYLPDESEGYNVKVEKRTGDRKIWKILRNGYPNVSKEELGVETDDDAYLATKQAIYWVIRGWRLSEVHNYFRGGEDEINGQNVEDIKRRGTKVVDAIYKLVDIAYNHKDIILSKPLVLDEEKLHQDSIKEDYYSKTYKITESNMVSKVKINSIKNAPEGTYISDEKGNPKTEFKDKENFKIMIPKANIDKDYKVKIEYTTSYESYPVYCANSIIENKQNYVILLNKTEHEDRTLRIDLESKKSKLKLKKIDAETKQPLQGVKFDISYADGTKIGSYETNENGEINLENLLKGTIKIVETKTDDMHILESNPIEVDLDYDDEKEIVLENKRIKGKIKIVKTSENQNKVLDTEAGSPIEGAKFNIYNKQNEFIEQITTDKNGTAYSSELDKGEYRVKEVETGEWYIYEPITANAEIKENNEIVEIKLKNKSKDPEVDITKKSKNLVAPNEELDYEFTIKNSGNTSLEDFTWYDILPSEYAKITKISTGTYNQDINYSVYYKTNKKDEYMVLKKELNSKENNYIDVTRIYLEPDEKITEIKVKFGSVDKGFQNVEKPHIFMLVNDGLENDIKIENQTILEGTHQTYKVCDEDETVTTIYNVVKPKKLPRTGF